MWRSAGATHLCHAGRPGDFHLGDPVEETVARADLEEVRPFVERAKKRDSFSKTSISGSSAGRPRIHVAVFRRQNRRPMSLNGVTRVRRSKQESREWSAG